MYTKIRVQLFIDEEHMVTQRQSIRNILQKYNLTTKTASKLLEVSVDTMKAYLTDPSSKRFRTIKTGQLGFLREQAQKRSEALKSIHAQFNSVLDKLGSFVLEEYGLKKEDLMTIYPPDKKQKSAKRLYKIIDAVNDIWVSYIYCETDD